MPILEHLAPRVRVLQIIAFTMLLGLLSFTGVVLFLHLGGYLSIPMPDVPVVTFVAIGMLLLQMPLSMLIPNQFIRRATKEIAAGTWSPNQGRGPVQTFHDDAERLLAVRQMAIIIKLTLLVGLGVFGCIAYLIERSPFALCVSAVVLLAMLLNFPTEWRTLSWVERQLTEIDTLRSRGA